MQLEKTKEIDATMRDINQLICKPIINAYSWFAINPLGFACMTMIWRPCWRKQTLDTIAVNEIILSSRQVQIKNKLECSLDKPLVCIVSSGDGGP